MLHITIQTEVITKLVLALVVGHSVFNLSVYKDTRVIKVTECE